MSDPNFPNQPPPPPPPPSYQPPPYTPPPGPPSQYYQQGSPGYIPPPIAPASGLAVAGGLAAQFRGRAAWSVGVGAATVILPLVFTGFYFRIWPILGIIYGIQAIRRGQMIGGAVGIVLNLIGGALSLFVSGLVHF